MVFHKKYPATARIKVQWGGPGRVIGVDRGRKLGRQFVEKHQKSGGCANA